MMADSGGWEMIMSLAGKLSDGAIQGGAGWVVGAVLEQQLHDMGFTQSTKDLLKSAVESIARIIDQALQEARMNDALADIADVQMELSAYQNGLTVDTHHPMLDRLERASGKVASLIADLQHFRIGLQGTGSYELAVGLFIQIQAERRIRFGNAEAKVTAEFLEHTAIPEAKVFRTAWKEWNRSRHRLVPYQTMNWHPGGGGPDFGPMRYRLYRGHDFLSEHDSLSYATARLREYAREEEARMMGDGGVIGESLKVVKKWGKERNRQYRYADRAHHWFVGMKDGDNFKFYGMRGATRHLLGYRVKNHVPFGATLIGPYTEANGFWIAADDENAHRTCWFGRSGSNKSFKIREGAPITSHSSSGSGTVVCAESDNLGFWLKVV